MALHCVADFTRVHTPRNQGPKRRPSLKLLLQFSLLCEQKTAPKLEALLTFFVFSLV